MKDIIDECVRDLNGGYYLDIFQVGSVQIGPICWPTKPRNKPYDICAANTQPSDIKGSTCSLKKKSTDQVQGIETRQSVVPSMKVPNKLISAPNVPSVKVANKLISAPNVPSVKVPKKMISGRKQAVTVTRTKKEEDDVNGKVKKMVSNVSNNSQDLHSEEESKLECTKRKLRQQYEQIENEKKRRRIQIIDLPPPVEMQKKQRKRADQTVKSTRMLHLTNSVY